MVSRYHSRIKLGGKELLSLDISIPLNERIARQTPGHTLEQAFYRDPEIFESEMSAIFLRQWLYVGHASRIPGPGDYFTHRIGQEPLVVIRGDDGAVHAHLNICRHKGSILCREAQGTAKKLVCPYHQWVYEPDGSLFHARMMPDDFQKSDWGLRSVAVHEVDGLIFVCFAETPPPFSEPNAGWLEPYGLDSAKVAHIATYTVNSNWKIVLENFMECYHCGVVHPEYTRVMAGASGSYLSGDEVTAQAGRSYAEAGKDAGRLGLDPSRPVMQFKRGAETQSMDGKRVAPLLGTYPAYDGAMMASWIGWTCEMELNPDYVCVFRFTPLDATRTEVEAHWLVRGDAVEGVDYEIDRLTTFWKVTGEQDWDICEVVQTGVASRHYVPGPMSHAEGGPRGFLASYLEILGDFVRTVGG